MKDAACLRVNGTYLRPDQVFWGSHPFGSHRAQLGPELVRYQSLLEGLGVRERPDFNDAIEVLKDISKRPEAVYSKQETRMLSSSAGSCCLTRWTRKTWTQNH